MNELIDILLSALGVMWDAATSAVGLLAALGLGGLIGNRITSHLDRRRDMYAEGVAAIVGWIEYPYAIRRRTSDSPETLMRLVEKGHDLQERLARSETWITAASSRKGDQYRAVVGDVKRLSGPLLEEAWRSPPIQTASDMVLSGWGADVTRSCRRVIDDFVSNLSSRKRRSGR